MNADVFLAAIDAATVAAQDTDHRKHLGASLIGRECARELFYHHRWVFKEMFDARMLRLFERGALEEDRFTKMLQAAGATVFTVDPNTGKQWRIQDCEGHFGGSSDGIAVNVPQLPPGMPCVIEEKTHNDKSFKKLKKEGLLKAKPEHHTQLQTYMFKFDIKVGLYLAVNKNDDEIYAEFVALDPGVGQRAIERARMIIFSDEAPLRIGNSIGWYGCMFCAFKPVCHGRATPAVNCRTCAHATPGPEGAWLCARGNSAVMPAQAGCHEHLFNPHLLNIVRVTGGDTEENWLELLRKDGTSVVTGPNHTPSHELEL